MEQQTIDFNGLNVSEAELTYRKESQPRVREIIRGNFDNKLQNILLGKKNSIIIVTGDRATGVTTTCLNIAKFFAEKIKTLYVDFDIDNNGLWSYLDYSKMENATEKQQNGIKMCTDKSAFEECILHISKNFDVLSSDYSANITTTDINKTKSVLAGVQNYNAIVIDINVSKLYQISDLILLADSILICSECSDRGLMNFFCRFEASLLQAHYKNILVKKGTIALTRHSSKCKRTAEELYNFYKQLLEPGEIDWFSMPVIQLSEDKMSETLMNNILSED